MRINKTTKPLNIPQTRNPGSTTQKDQDSLLKQASYIGAAWCNVCQMSFVFEHLAFILDMREKEQGKKHARTGPGQNGTWSTGIGFQTCQLSPLSHTGTHMVQFSIFSTPKLWEKKYSPDLCFILTL